MNKEQFQLSKLLEKLNDDLAPIDRYLVNEEINRIIPSENYQPTPDDNAEYMAFALEEKFGESKFGYGNYFGPFSMSVADDGTEYMNPPLHQITPEMVTYWEKRSEETSHPFFIARYAGLSWDLSQTVFKQTPKHSLRNKFLNATMQIVEKRLFTRPHVGVLQLRRAAEIATKYNDEKVYSTIKKITLELEKEFRESRDRGSWGFGFDILFNNKKLDATTQEMTELIDDLEDKLAEFRTPDVNGKTDPWLAEAAATRLAAYYLKNSKPLDAKRVILCIGDAYEPLFINVQNFQIAGWLQTVYKLYKHYQLKDEAAIVLKRLRETSKKAVEEMGVFEYPFSVPKEQVEELISFIFENNDSVFQKIVFRFIPSKEQTKDSVLKLAKESPFMFSFTKELQDKRGRKVAEVGSIEADLDGRIILGIVEQFPFSSIFLHSILDAAVKRNVISTNSVINFLSESAIINIDRQPILEKGLDAYFAGNFIVFIHLVVPQFEEAIRNMVEMNGGTVLKYKNDIYNLRTFDDILRDPIVTNVLGDDLQTYLRILFTDSRGWNIRNQVCHGLVDIEFFNKHVSDRIFHALLSLGLVRLITEE